MTDAIVIVGNGMGGARLAESLIAAGVPGRRITVIGKEPGGAYNRVMLTPLLAGEIAEADLVTHAPDWYAERGIRLLTGNAVVAIDRAARRVTLENGESVDFGHLVLATGSRPVRPPIPGVERALTYRDLDDTRRLLALEGSAVVIGGGLLGLEAANGLAARGLAVTVVHLMDRLLERQLDGEAAGLLQVALEARGIQFRLRASTTAIEDSSVLLASGERIAADHVVLAVGIRPDTSLAAAAGLALGRGIQVDDRLATSDPAILAIGECVEHRGSCPGLVAPIFEQARIAAEILAGRAATYAGSIEATSLKVTGINVYSAGDFAPGGGRHSMWLRDAARGVYRRLVVEGDRLVGAVLLGDVADGPWYADLIRRDWALGPAARDLLFGPAYVPVLAEAAE